MTDRRRGPALLMVAFLAGCAGVKPDSSAMRIEADVGKVTGESPMLSTPATPTAETGVIALDRAMSRALSMHPEMQRQYAALQISAAEVDAATRLPNPGFSIARFGIDGGHEVARRVALSLGALVANPDRRAVARLDRQRTDALVTDAILGFAHRVEVAWFQAVSAEQAAALSQLIRRADRQSANLAERMVAAGNLPAHEAAEFRAEAAASAIAATRAEARRLKARLALANLIVLPVDGDWTIPTSLPMPMRLQASLDDLTRIATEARFDLKALDLEVAAHERALSATRRWRWFGEAEFEYEHERADGEPDKQGPGLSVTLPLFDQGQSAVLEAQGALTSARAERDEAQATLRNDLLVARSSVVNAFEVARLYRDVLLPHREIVVAGHQREVDFMLKGAFELLAVRREQYAAYREYLVAVRDYWLAYSALNQQVGWQLPDSDRYRHDAAADVGIDLFEPTEGVPDPHAHH